MAAGSSSSAARPLAANTSRFSQDAGPGGWAWAGYGASRTMDVGVLRKHGELS